MDISNQIDRAANVGKQAERIGQVQREIQAHLHALGCLRQELADINQKEPDAPMDDRPADAELSGMKVRLAMALAQAQALQPILEYATHQPGCYFKPEHGEPSCTCGFTARLKVWLQAQGKWPLVGPQDHEARDCDHAAGWCRGSDGREFDCNEAPP